MALFDSALGDPELNIDASRSWDVLLQSQSTAHCVLRIKCARVLVTYQLSYVLLGFLRHRFIFERVLRLPSLSYVIGVWSWTL